MPAGQQSDPPDLDHIAPKWFHDLWQRLVDWLKTFRPVGGIGIYISDAPGGGSLINCNVKAVAQAIGSIKLAFSWYPSPYTGGGTAPANQGLKIRLRPGTINGEIVPSNMNSEFTLSNNQTNYLKLTTTNSIEGFATSAVLTVSATPPSGDPPGSLNTAPATSTRTIWTFTTSNNKITDDVASRIGDLDMTPLAYQLACGGAYVRLFWSPTSEV